MKKTVSLSLVSVVLLSGCATPSSSNWENWPTPDQYVYLENGELRVLKYWIPNFAQWFRCDVSEIDVRVLSPVSFASINTYQLVSCPSKGIENVRCIGGDGYLSWQCENSQGEILQLGKTNYFTY